MVDRRRREIEVQRIGRSRDASELKLLLSRINIPETKRAAAENSSGEERWKQSSCSIGDVANAIYPHHRHVRTSLDSYNRISLIGGILNTKMGEMCQIT